MADIKQIQIGSTVYNIKDETARNSLATIATNLQWNDSTRTFSWSVSGRNYSFQVPEGATVANMVTADGQEPVTSQGIYTELVKKTDIDGAGRLAQTQSPITYLRKITGDPFDGGEVLNVGDAWLEEVNPGEFVISYKNTSTTNISLGAPSPDLIYCHTDTKKLYKWNGSAMIQIAVPTYNSSAQRLIF